MKILLLAAEAAPLVRVSEAGEAVGGLVRALAELDHVVRVALPYSGVIDRAHWAPALVARVSVPHVGGSQTARVFEVREGGVIFNLIAGPPIPRAKRVYGADIHEDAPKFIFMGMAALGLCRALDWQPDIVHGWGSPAGPAVYWLDTDGRHDALFQQAATVFTLNDEEDLKAGAGRYLLEYGLAPSDAPGLPDEARGALLGVGVGHGEVVARLTPRPPLLAARNKGAGQERGSHSSRRAGKAPSVDYEGTWLDEVLAARSERVTQIPNGLDLEAWNPRTERQLVARYDVNNLDRRAANKRALQRALGLPLQPNAPLIGVVTRGPEYTGGSLTETALHALLQAGAATQVVVLGEGRPVSKVALREAFPERVRLAGLELPLSRFYAGVDVALVSGRYAASRLAVLLAWRFGAVPVVAEGGPVIDYAETRRGTGFSFSDYNAGGLLAALQRALRVHAQPGRWRAVQRRGMRQAGQLAWARSAAAYLALYQQANIYRKEAVTRLSARLADEPVEGFPASFGG